MEKCPEGEVGHGSNCYTESKTTCSNGEYRQDNKCVKSCSGKDYIKDDQSKSCFHSKNDLSKGNPNAAQFCRRVRFRNRRILKCRDEPCPAG